jgi:osmoprotectant transport system substrate-binding protein
MDRRNFLAGTTTLLLAGCSHGPRHTAVGTKNFTEQLVLGELLAQTLERYTQKAIDRRFYLAGSYICQQAILAARIDTYVEYTGTALAAILKLPIRTDSNEVFETVRSEYRKRFHLEAFPSLGFNNTFAIAMRGEDARARGLTTLSELAKYAPELKLGVGYEFLEREDGFPGLSKTYGLKFAAPPIVMDLGLLYRALQARQVDVIAGSNTDGLIAALGLVVLEDDRNYFPPYDAVPIVRPEALNSVPGFRQALATLTGKISTQDMRAMNYAVDGEKKDAADVVRAFLTRSG